MKYRGEDGTDGLDDRDDPQEIDLDEEEDADDDQVRCTACGAWMHEQAAVCPRCGEWQIETSEAQRRAMGWFWPVMVALLVAVIVVVWSGLGR